MRISTGDVPSHGGGLGIGSQDGVVIGCTGIGHRADGFAIQLRRHHSLANEPVERTGVLVIDASIDAGAKNVAGRLVQRSGLIRILQASGVLRDSVRKLVAGNVNIIREIPKDHIVAITEHHPSSIPKSVVKTSSIVYVGVEVDT